MKWMSLDSDAARSTTDGRMWASCISHH